MIQFGLNTCLAMHVRLSDPNKAYLLTYLLFFELVQIEIPISEVVDVTREKTAFIIPNAIGIHTVDNSKVFSHSYTYTCTHTHTVSLYSRPTCNNRPYRFIPCIRLRLVLYLRCLDLIYLAHYKRRYERDRNGCVLRQWAENGCLVLIESEQANLAGSIKMDRLMQWQLLYKGSQRHRILKEEVVLGGEENRVQAMHREGKRLNLNLSRTVVHSISLIVQH